MEAPRGPQKGDAENQTTQDPRTSTRPIPPFEAATELRNNARLQPDKFHNLGDSLGFFGLAITLLFWALAPTLIEKTFAIAACGGMFVYLAYKSYFTKGMPRRWQHTIAVLLPLIVLAGGGLQVFNQWRIDNAVTSQVRSKLGAELIIDSAGNGVIQFHFALLNEGPFEAQIIRVSHHNDCELGSDGDMVRSRIILPHDRLTVNEVILDNDRNCGTLYLQTSYSTPVEGIQKAFTSTFGFMIRPIDLHPQTLYPISHDEVDGEPINEFEQDFLRVFGKPHGMVSLRWPERLPNGDANVLDVKSGAQELHFDPVLKVIVFSSTVNGRDARIQRPLGTPKEGIHLVVATWNEKGELRLSVDGVTK